MKVALRTILFLLFFTAVLTVNCHAQSDAEIYLDKATSVLRMPDSALLYLSKVDLTGASDSELVEYNRLTGSAYFYKGYADSAVVYLSHAYALVDSSQCSRQFASVVNALAVILHRSEARDKASQFYVQALGCAEYLNDTLLKSRIYNNLSIILLEIGEVREASSYADKSIDLYKKLGNGKALAGAFNSKGQIFLSLNKLDSAWMFFEKSYLLRQSNDDRNGLAIALNNMGYVRARQEKYDEAVDLYKQSAEIRQKLGNLLGQASILVNLAEVEVERANLVEASEYLENAEIINEQLRSADLTSRILLGRSELAKATGQFEDAFTLLRSHYQLEDSLRSDRILAEVNSARYAATIAEARNNVKRAKLKEIEQGELISRQRLINLWLGISLAVFIGLLSLLLYQLRALANLRATLSQQKELAEKQAKSRKEALSEVVHEIRTPINAMISLTEVIMEEDDMNEIRTYSDIINKSAHRLSNTINNVLSISRIEEGNYQLVSIRENITQMLSDLIDSLSPQAKTKGIELHRKLEEEAEVWLETDRSVVEIILMNIVGNAIKFTSTGQVTVSLTESSDEVIIAISDTGPGIKEEEKEKIFEAFYQSAAAKTVSQQGSGLGLSITKAYMDLLKAKIKVDSVVGEGSVFTLFFPKA